MKRVLRASLVALIGLVLCSGAVMFSPAQVALAAVNVPVAPQLNVLPSVVNAVTAGLTTADARAIWMYKFGKAAIYWAAVNANKAGTATATQITLVKNEAGNFAVPATKAASMAKVVGSGVAVFSTLQLGMSLGNGAARLLGFNDSQVCSQNNALLTSVAAITNGVDCSSFINQIPEAQKNADATQATSAITCLSDGECVKLENIAPYQGTSTTTRVDCYRFSGTALNGNTYISWNNQSAATTNPNHTGVSGSYGCASGQWGLTSGPYSDPLAWFYLTSNASSVTDSPKTYPVQSKGNPQRTFRCDITNTAGKVYSGSGSAFTESDPVFVPPACPVLPPAEIPNTVKIVEATPNQPDQTVLPSAPVTQNWKDWKSTYPTCQDGSCPLDLAYQGVSCYTTPGPCLSWFTSPTKSSDFQCSYAGKNVVIDECNVLSPSFDPAKVASGHGYADPQTGAEVASETTPSADGNAASRDSDGACFASGWATFNPLEWILKPLKCAFMPSQSAVSAAQNRLATRISGTTMMQAATSLNLAQLVLPNSAGCSGVTVDMSWIPLVSIPVQHFLPACKGDFFAPMAPLFYWFITVAISITGIFGVFRHVGALVNYDAPKGD